MARASRSGYGTPGFRVFAGVAYVAPEAKAQPEPQPEPKPEPKPAPAPDTDGDGMTDAKDACPTRPEDMDGFQDEDGCPDPDNDNGRHPGRRRHAARTSRRRRTASRTRTAARTRCRRRRDTDGDGLTDDKDRCPQGAEDKDGFEDEDGCPDPDNDKDGVADAADKCPTEPETINGVKDEDGCPDKGKVKVLVEGEKIVILDKVFFANNKDIILPKSFPLLQQVAQVLRANPQIELVRVEGHTDDKGEDGANLDLSQRRAKAVRERLIEQEGIAAERLEAVGYGETQAGGHQQDRQGPREQPPRRVHHRQGEAQGGRSRAALNRSPERACQTPGPDCRPLTARRSALRGGSPGRDRQGGHAWAHPRRDVGDVRSRVKMAPRDLTDIRCRCSVRRVSARQDSGMKQPATGW